MFNYKDTFNQNYILEHSINKLNSFICGYYMDEKHLGICDDLIDNHNKEFHKKPFYGNMASELEDEKISTDLDEQIFLCLNNYAVKYPASVISLPGIIEKCIVQSSTEGKQWNSIECVTVDKEIRKRHLGIILFLNEVEDGGNIIFYHQQLKIKPRKGMILLYPDNWQFIYSIEPSKQELFWLSGHISNVNSEEKIEYTPKLKMTTSSEPVNYNFGL